jgi:hypothetical protein
MSKVSPIDVQIAIIRLFISLFQNILSILACSVFNILPLSGSIAWITLFLHCLADQPAESPSTMYNSDTLGSRLEQSESFHGRVIPSNAHFLITVSLAARAANLAFAAKNTFSHIFFASLGFSSKNSKNFSQNTESTAHLASAVPSFDLVCHSNCGSITLTEITQVNHSTTSSFVRF